MSRIHRTPCRVCGYRHQGTGTLCLRCQKLEEGVLESPAVLRDGRWVNDHGVQRWQANGLRLVRT